MEEKGERFEEGILMEAFGPEPLEKTGLKDMGKFICRVNGNLTGTGFFCKIPYKNRIFYTLITNYHIIDDNFLENNEYLTLYIDIDKRKSIDISINRKIYSSIINKYEYFNNESNFINGKNKNTKEPNLNQYGIDLTKIVLKKIQN